MPDLRGKCSAVYAYEVGRSADLRRCREIFRDTATRLPEVRKRPAPSLFGLSEHPTVWLASPAMATLCGAETEIVRRAAIYDFGCISVSLELSLAGDAAAWRDMAIDLSVQSALGKLARATLDEAIGHISEAIVDFEVSRRFAPYFIYQLDRVPTGDAGQWLAANELLVAQILRGESSALAEHQVKDTIQKRISYAPDDLVVIDYAASLIVDSESADTVAVLEFANIELLSLQVLDEQLDDALATANRLIHSRTHGARNLVRPFGKPIRKLVELTVDAAAEFEAVDNAIKLTDDHYLGRVYRLAADRFHLTGFDTDITRKLQTLWNIHTIYIERAATRRSELLEWIIILLIALEIFTVVR